MYGKKSPEVKILDFIELTRYSGNLPLISPIFSFIVNIMGVIMDYIFRATSALGVQNIGLCIILFTIVTRILMFPLSYNQGKSSRLMGALQPEIKAVQKKYAGKQDQQSMMLQQAEIKTIYEKYGVSMTGGCSQLLIQMPIIFALYRVILNIPAYVASVKVPFQNIVDAIGGEAAVDTVNSFAHSTEELSKIISQARISGDVIATPDNIIDFLYNLNPTQWDAFKNLFSSAADVISQNYTVIEDMNNFLGLNLATSPAAYGLTSVKAWIIPVLAGLSQFAATKLMTKSQSKTMEGNDQMAQTMNTMNMMMPLMSVVFCFSFASGIGVYWIASSVLMGVQQYFLNKHFEKTDINELVKANIDKANKKRARKGQPPIDEKSLEEEYNKAQAKLAAVENRKQQKLDKAKEAMDKNNEYYELTSIADRARMVEQFNNKKSKKK